MGHLIWNINSITKHGRMSTLARSDRAEENLELEWGTSILIFFRNSRSCLLKYVLKNVWQIHSRSANGLHRLNRKGPAHISPRNFYIQFRARFWQLVDWIGRALVLSPRETSIFDLELGSGNLSIQETPRNHMLDNAPAELKIFNRFIIAQYFGRRKPVVPRWSSPIPAGREVENTDAELTFCSSPHGDFREMDIHGHGIPLTHQL